MTYNGQFQFPQTLPDDNYLKCGRQGWQADHWTQVPYVDEQGHGTQGMIRTSASDTCDLGVNAAADDLSLLPTSSFPDNNLAVPSHGGTDIGTHSTSARNGVGSFWGAALTSDPGSVVDWVSYGPESDAFGFGTEPMDMFQLDVQHQTRSGEDNPISATGFGQGNAIFPALSDTQHESSFTDTGPPIGLEYRLPPDILEHPVTSQAVLLQASNSDYSDSTGIPHDSAVLMQHPGTEQETTPVFKSCEGDSNIPKSSQLKKRKPKANFSDLSLRRQSKGSGLLPSASKVSKPSRVRTRRTLAAQRNRDQVSWAGGACFTCSWKKKSVSRYTDGPITESH
jgi:hypothetical protein